MSFDTYMSIGCMIVAAISYALYRYSSENVYLGYKNQKVGR